MPDGTKYVSSVLNGGVSRIRPGQPAELIAQNIPNAASMCYDAGGEPAGDSDESQQRARVHAAQVGVARRKLEVPLFPPDVDPGSDLLAEPRLQPVAEAPSDADLRLIAQHGDIVAVRILPELVDDIDVDDGGAVDADEPARRRARRRAIRAARGAGATRRRACAASRTCRPLRSS